ncbi:MULTISPECIES: hypothetical protein [Methanobacterium]|uniref:Uncharacterized protein n=2 Tax=Methanobacterium TaxID=2160 RepID=A0A9E5A0A9_9EURY|nr:MULTISPECIES: hypothetical protein [Methanobacterium]MCZ3367248.1 hypothetical protein [Methanobacterium veterum]MCZ3373604.1 hypothetical protein [Methanobacterium veterum]OEC85170.1 hypothetical protein A9507_14265 [Methanobacterium sp. A39]PAV05351.1 hypothetical protein ASJ80_10190 [Methanobacterium bryantii]
MKRPMLILLLTFIAAVGMTGAASAQLIDINLTLGPNASLLDPTQNQTQDQAQAQTQVSTITNTNNLTNANTNVATSTSSSTNTNIISNNNTFNPVMIFSNSNSVGTINLSSYNLNF